MTKDAIKTITAQTKVPLGIVAVVCLTSAPWLVFVTKLEARQTTHETTDNARVMKLTARTSKLESVMFKIDRRLYRLELERGIQTEPPEMPDGDE